MKFPGIFLKTVATIFVFSALTACGGGDGGGGDVDEDGILDSDDNCPLISNVSQLDTNSDGVGDACDTDDDVYKYKNSVKYFGALGDGVTDDTGAIQDALNAFAGGGSVYFPPGKYVVKKTLIVERNSDGNPNQGRPGIGLIGGGPNASVILCQQMDGFCLDIRGKADETGTSGRDGIIEGITIDSIGFQGDRSSSLAGIYIQAFSHVQFDNARVAGFVKYGVHLDRKFYTAELDDRATYAGFRNTEISDTGEIGLWAGGVFEVDHLVMERVSFTQHGGIGAKIWAHNFVDIGSLFYGATHGLVLYEESADNAFKSSNNQLIGTRFEGGPSVANLEIGGIDNFECLNCAFIASQGVKYTPTMVSLGKNTGPVSSAIFSNCRFYSNSTKTMAFAINEGVTNVRVIEPIWRGAAFEHFDNPHNSRVQLLEQGSWVRVAGGGPSLEVRGALGTALEVRVCPDSEVECEKKDEIIALGYDSNTHKLSLGSRYNSDNVTLERRTLDGKAGLAVSGPLAFQFDADNPSALYSGSGNPNGSVSAALGSIYMNRLGGAGVTMWVKESGDSGTSGWVAK